MDELNSLLEKIGRERPTVIRYRDAEKNLFSKEPEIKKTVKAIGTRLSLLRQRYEDRRARIVKKYREMEERHRAVLKELNDRKNGLDAYRQMVENERLVPDEFLSDGSMLATDMSCQQLISRLRGTVKQKRESIGTLKETVVSFNRNFKPQNAFHFNTMPVTDQQQNRRVPQAHQRTL